MNLSGGYWMWSACLRYFRMLPILALLLWRLPGDRFRPVLATIRARPAAWLVWSTVGFGLFYLPLTLGSVFGESWLVAASWQVTIVAGVLLTPVFGMTLCSMPFWLAVACAAFARAGAPSGGQLVQSGVVALFSGVIATVLFFRATDLVRNDPRQLALIEATQCGEVIFTLLGGILVLGDIVPGPAGMAGLALILLGMVLNSLVTAK